VDATAVVATDDPAATDNVSYSAATTVDVTDASSSLSFDVDGPNVEGSQEQIQSNFSDPEGRTPTAYTINWGDGHVDSYGQSPDYGGFFGHTYTEASAPGNFTLTEVATVGDEQFTATNQVEIYPSVPGLTVVDPGYADGGQAFYAEAFFVYDQAGNLTGQFPVPNHPATYTVDWGDGETDTFDSNQFTHTYAFDDSATPTNNYQFTVTAEAGEYSSSCIASADVLPSDGSGMLIPADAPGDITEGTAFTLSGASFSDEAQTDDGYQGANMTVWWGDGNSDSLDCTGDDPPAFDPTHLYAEPGSYAVTFGAGYDEDHEPGGLTGYVVYTEPFTVTAAEATPTISGEGTPSSLTAGDEYSLAPTYSDSVGDHFVEALTVDWGDGLSSVYEGYIPFIASHIYATAGTFEPSLSLTAFADDGHITGSAREVDVGKPTAGITAGDATADESGQQPASFEVTRTGTDFDVPLTVNYSVGGTLDSDAYVVTDENGMILDGTATIPAGSSAAELFVYPLEDHTPRWTETVDLTLSSSDNYAVDDDNSAAGCYVVNDDLYAWLDNGSDNDIFEGGTPADGGTIVPLVVDLPAETRDGAVITLTDNAANEADVYTTADPGEGDTPILGDVDGTTVSEVTWTYGVDDDAPSGMTTLYVEGISGSASVNDISFEVNDSDANCGPDGTDTNPVAPQDEGGGDTYATTSVSGTGNRAADQMVELFSQNSPNAGDYTGLVGDQAQPWLVGQMVDLKALVVGPVGTVGANYQWNIPSSDSVLYRWNVSQEQLSAAPVALANLNVDSIDPGAPVTGKKQQEIQFFWVAAPSSNPDTISVSVSGLSLTTDPSNVFSASAKFNVQAPSVTGGSIAVGTIGAIPGKSLGLFSGVNDPHGNGVGMTLKATVNVPEGFGQGAWNILQLDQLTQTYGKDVNVGGQLQLQTFKTIYPQTQPGLDGAWPISQQYVDSNDRSQLGDPFSGSGWTTSDTSHFWDDKPAIDAQHKGWTGYTSNEAFTDYIMFLPPGTGSQWVPLQMGTWGYHLGANTPNPNKPGVWTWVGGDPNVLGVNPFTSTTFSPATTEPSWNFVVDKDTDAQWTPG